MKNGQPVLGKQREQQQGGGGTSGGWLLAALARGSKERGREGAERPERSGWARRPDLAPQGWMGSEERSQLCLQAEG